MSANRIKWLISQFVALLAGWLIGGAYGFAVCFALFLLIDIRVAVEELKGAGHE